MLKYPQLIQACFETQVSEQEQIPLPDELALQSLWYNGQFGRSFKGDQGQYIRIRQFGFWNHAAGPDFHHCSVEVDGTVSNGAIELDPHAQDWEAHGHQQNPNYNQVVLHVVFDEPCLTYFTRSENHSAIPRVLVPKSRVQEALQQARYAEANSTIGRCYKPLQETTEPQVFKLLESAATFRRALKAKRFLSTTKAHSYSQALWVALAETLGYHNNRFAMLTLAQRLPIKQLIKNPSLIDSLLFGVAGFLTAESYEKAPAETKDWLGSLWKDWWKLRATYELTEERSIQWTMSGNRPVNHPHRRIAALAAIAKQWNKVVSLSPSPLALSEFLTELTDRFWNRHYTLNSESSSRRLALIGKQRVHDFLINHLLPHAISQGSESALSLYHQIPAPTLSNSIKRVHYRIFGHNSEAAVFLKKAWQHQALLQIYHDFCLEDNSDCEQCPFPEMLRQQLS